MADDAKPCLHCALSRVIRAHPGPRADVLPALANVVADNLACASDDQVEAAIISHGGDIVGFVKELRALDAPPDEERLH